MALCSYENCGETLADMQLLREHISSSHLKYFPYKCMECGIMFASRWQVELHWDLEHKSVLGPLTDVSVTCFLDRHNEMQLNELIGTGSGSNGSNVTKLAAVKPEPIQEMGTSSDELISVNTTNDDDVDDEEDEYDEQELAKSFHIETSVKFARILLKKRSQLGKMPLIQRMKYFCGQLAAKGRPRRMSCEQMNAKLTSKHVKKDHRTGVSKRGTDLSSEALIALQSWPADLMLRASMREFQDELPKNNDRDLANLLNELIFHMKVALWTHRNLTEKHSERKRNSDEMTGRNGFAEETNGSVFNGKKSCLKFH